MESNYPHRNTTQDIKTNTLHNLETEKKKQRTQEHSPCFSSLLKSECPKISFNLYMQIYNKTESAKYTLILFFPPRIPQTKLFFFPTSLRSEKRATGSIQINYRTKNLGCLHLHDFISDKKFLPTKIRLQTSE